MQPRKRPPACGYQQYGYPVAEDAPFVAAVKATFRFLIDDCEFRLVGGRGDKDDGFQVVDFASDKVWVSVLRSPALAAGLDPAMGPAQDLTFWLRR